MAASSQAAVVRPFLSRVKKGGRCPSHRGKVLLTLRQDNLPQGRLQVGLVHATDTETTPKACPLALGRMMISTSRSRSVTKRSSRSEREPAQLVVFEVRDVRLRNAEELGRSRLGQAACRDQLVEPHRELHAEPPLVSIREAKVHQDVTAPASTVSSWSPGIKVTS
jgi:hypothetical protein